MKITNGPKIDFSQIKQLVASELKGTTGLSVDQVLEKVLKLAARGAKASQPQPSGLAHPKARLGHLHGKHASHKVPNLASRASAMAGQATALSFQVGSSGPAPEPGPQTGPGLADPGLFRDGGLTKDQQDSLAGLDPKSTEYKRTEAQFKLQNHAETMAFISNYFKMLHDTQMSIVRNIS